MRSVAGKGYSYKVVMKTLTQKAGLYALGILVAIISVASGLSVSAQPSEPSVLCANGSRIPVRLLTATSCEENGSVTVNDAIRDLCINLEPINARRDCLTAAGIDVNAGSGDGGVRVQPDCSGGLQRGCPIFDYILLTTNLLSAAVGVVVVTMIAVGGVQYISARDNPQAVSAARGRIFNAVLALILYMAVAAFLQWLVPGGVLSP